MKSVYLKLFFILFFISCIENVPIRPIYTGDTDWVPEIFLDGNGYKRFRIEWNETYPPQEVGRNIDKLFYELSTDNGTHFECIDSLNYALHPFLSSYDSQPILTEGRPYSARVKVSFRDGTENISNVISFTAAYIPGEVLKRIYIADDSTLYPNYSVTWPDKKPSYHPRALSFDNGYIYVKQSSYLTRIDTLTHEVVLITDELSLFTHQFDDYDPFIIKDSILYLPNNSGSDLTKFNVFGMQEIAEIRFTPLLYAADVYVYLIHNDLLYINVRFYSDSIMNMKVNASSYEIVERYSVNYRTPQGAYDGTTFWSFYFGERYEPAIYEIDINSGQLIFSNQRKIPILDASGLTWDGTGFWVFDPHSSSLAKIRPEGM